MEELADNMEYNNAKFMSSNPNPVKLTILMNPKNKEITQRRTINVRSNT